MSATSQPIATLEQNKKLLVRWFEEVWNHGNRDVIHQLLAPECVIHDGANTMNGAAEFERFYDGLRSRFSEVRVSSVFAIAEGDLACVHWFSQVKEAATGKTAHVTGTSIVRVKDGRFIEGWQNWDHASLAAQLSGTAPTPLY
jgi:predicted SnoaL-like aldol condensation-catalyzing enzyme